MKKIDFVIINEYIRTKLVNEEGLEIEELEKYDDFYSKLWATVTRADFDFIENWTSYCKDVLNHYNLSFFDSRCIYYLSDACQDMTRNIF